MQINEILILDINCVAIPLFIYLTERFYDHLTVSGSNEQQAKLRC